MTLAVHTTLLNAGGSTLQMSIPKHSKVVFVYLNLLSVCILTTGLPAPGLLDLLITLGGTPRLHAATFMSPGSKPRQAG